MRMINLTIEFIQNIELSSDTNYLPKIIKQKQTSDEKQEEELIIKEDNQLEKKENIFLKRLKYIKKIQYICKISIIINGIKMKYYQIL